MDFADICSETLSCMRRANRKRCRNAFWKPHVRSFQATDQPQEHCPIYSTNGQKYLIDVSRTWARNSENSVICQFWIEHSCFGLRFYESQPVVTVPYTSISCIIFYIIFFVFIELWHKFTQLKLTSTALFMQYSYIDIAPVSKLGVAHKMALSNRE